MNTSVGLHSYRTLLRAAGIAFRGDHFVLNAAKFEIRRTFDAHKSLPASESASKIQHAIEVANVLRMNVVQGKKNDAEPDKYGLRIHKDIELGDNETIAKDKKTNGSRGNCCST